ncbi:hypothetical protein D9M68_982620 [compost metagenome]
MPRHLNMHVQTGQQATAGYALVVFEQLKKMILLRGLLQTPVRQRMAADTE